MPNTPSIYWVRGYRSPRMPVSDYDIITLPISKGLANWQLPANRSRARATPNSTSSKSTGLTSLVSSDDSEDDSELGDEEFETFMNKHNIEVTETSTISHPTRSTCSAPPRIMPSTTTPSAAPMLQRSPSVSSLTSNVSKRSSERSFSGAAKKRRVGVAIFGSRCAEVMHA